MLPGFLSKGFKFRGQQGSGVNIDDGGFPVDRPVFDHLGNRFGTS